ncbi:alpha-isopropylmalate synthase regulatory domain-containing protein, partial [Streptomyces sp. NPDC056121]
YLLATHHGVDLPARMRPEFARVVQEATDDSGQEATPKDLYELFGSTYLEPGRGAGHVSLSAWSTDGDGQAHRFVCTLHVGDRTGDFEGRGGGTLSAFVDALAAAGVAVDIVDFTEDTHGEEATAYTQCRVDGVTAWGAGRDSSPLTASVQAVLAAVNRAVAAP